MKQITKFAVWLSVHILASSLLFPALAAAQPKKPGAKPKKIHWYMDYTVTVKGSGRKEGVGGGPTIVWSIDRTYSGGVALNERNIHLTSEEAQDWKIQAEAFKTERKLQFSNVRAIANKEALIRVQINDKLEIITKEECSDNSEETTTNVKIWKIDATSPSPNPISLYTDSALLTYNVAIPIWLSSERGGWPNMPMMSQTIYGRSNNVPPSKNGTGVVTSDALIPALPNVRGLIDVKLFVMHKPDRPFPANFSTAWEYDSGNLQPDEPLIQHVPDSKTNVNVRVRYRFSKTPIY